MSSDYKTKLNKATFELYEKGVKRKYSHTLAFKFLRLCGFEVRLPAYSEPRTVLIYTSIYFACVTLILYGFLQWKANSIDLVSLISVAVLLGAATGLIMMWLTDYKQKKYELTPWEEL